MVKPGCGVIASGLVRLTAVFEAIALAVHFQNVDVVSQPVEKRASEAFGSEGAGPLIERQVGRHDG